MAEPIWRPIEKGESERLNIGGEDRLGCAPFHVVVREPNPVVTVACGICATRQDEPPKCAPAETLKVSASDAANFRNSGGCGALSAGK